MSAWNPHNPFTVSLRRLFADASFVDCGDLHVSDVSERSDCCGPQTLFAALPGTRHHGLEYVADAVAQGAFAVLVDRPVADISVPQCVVPNVRTAFARLCHALSGDAAARLKVAGVTGTNGKSTVTWLIRSILRTSGHQTGLLGTIEYDSGCRVEKATLTTPDCRTLFTWLDDMVQCGTTHAAIEVSSHALDQDRMDGVGLDAAVVTNITHDHFDYHGNYEAYYAAKSKIVSYCKSGDLIINCDDAGSQSLLDRLPDSRDVMTYGITDCADVSGRIVDESSAGSQFVLTLDGSTAIVKTSLIGRHNVSNCLAAAAVAHRFGVPLNGIVEGIAALSGVPGRLEQVGCGQPFHVFVDYAHTPDALQKCLESLRHVIRGRLICVFGAGGDRDPLKRPALGQAASLADIAVVTSDNPRSESPERIIDEVAAGVDRSVCGCFLQPDRKQAIHWAIQQAGEADCVLVAGKGHETEQIIGSERIPFDDRIVIRDALSRTGPPPPHLLRQHAHV